MSIFFLKSDVAPDNLHTLLPQTGIARQHQRVHSVALRQVRCYCMASNESIG
jgi:hypothetical protein